jgi:hypothetical protein
MAQNPNIVVKITLNNMLQASHIYRLVAKDGTGIYTGSVGANTNALNVTVNAAATKYTQYSLQINDVDGNVVNSSLASAVGGIVIIENIAIIEEGLSANTATIGKTMEVKKRV